ncbi:MAG: flavodoxin family protein [Ruminococcaceae bacterium]|nr:flavodoxin family protein [Oscillospiraceae bacterium]
MMKTLILNGSTRTDGDTAALLNAFLEKLEGEVKMVTQDWDITPCQDCRWCEHNSGCCINDRMQEVYRYLDECDNVVVASPVWFSSLSGVALNIASRLQTRYKSHIRDGQPLPDKNGVIFLVGARPSTDTVVEKSAKLILRYMNVRRPIIGIIRSMNTDRVPAAEDEAALREARLAAIRLNDEYKNRMDL